jgi:hypothetical protein
MSKLYWWRIYSPYAVGCIANVAADEIAVSENGVGLLKIEGKIVSTYGVKDCIVTKGRELELKEAP